MHCWGQWFILHFILYPPSLLLILIPTLCTVTCVCVSTVWPYNHICISHPPTRSSGYSPPSPYPAYAEIRAFISNLFALARFHSKPLPSAKGWGYERYLSHPCVHAKRHHSKRKIKLNAKRVQHSKKAKRKMHSAFPHLLASHGPSGLYFKLALLRGQDEKQIPVEGW